MHATDDTTRRLNFCSNTAVAAPQQLDVTPHRPAHAAGLPQPPAPLASAEGEAEQALRGLEAEWAMRMEAPLSALAGLEDTLTRAIDEAATALPFPPP